MCVLKVQQAAFSYGSGGREIFSDVSFTLKPGQILSIIGPNGSGKSTLLNCLAALLKLSAGEIFFEGKPQNTFKKKELARIIGYVPQQYTLSYGYSVRDYAVMGCAPHIGILASPGEREYARADAALERMGISFLAERPYTEISGGERQQATIARVLVQNPKIIMMDEPTSALDYGNQMRTIQLIKDLAKQNYAVVLTTHTPDHAIMLDGTVGLLDRRGKLSVGSVSDIMKEDTLKKIYRTDLKLVYVPEAGRVTCIALNRDGGGPYST